MKTPKTSTGSTIEYHLHQQSAKCAPRSSSSSNWLGSHSEMRLGHFCLPVSRLAETLSLVLGSRSMAQQPSAGGFPALPVGHAPAKSLAVVLPSQWMALMHVHCADNSCNCI